MNKKTLLLLGLVIIVLVVAVWFVLNFNKQKNNLPSPISTEQQAKVEITPSKTTKSYSDPSGFSFNYPDNLSLLNSDSVGPNTYADIKLTANGIGGSLDLKISDTQFPSITEWLKANSITVTPKEASLGSLKALEVTTKDKLLLAALDQGVLFTIEIPKGENNFWADVYKKVVEEFSFAPPAVNTTSQGVITVTDEVIFEGEEVVE